MIGYIHIYVDSNHYYNWRYFRIELPMIGDIINPNPSNDKIDFQYMVKKIEHVEGTTYRLHCEDLSKEKYGPFKPPKTMMDYFHDMDKDMVNRYKGVL